MSRCLKPRWLLGWSGPTFHNNSHLPTNTSGCLRSFGSSPGSSSNFEVDDEDAYCLIGERYKYHSWPSEEHAAFAFACLASPGNATIGMEEFCSVLLRMKLDYHLTRVELERVFRALDLNSDGQLSLEEFKIGRTSSPFTKAVIETLSGAGTEHHPGQEELDLANFDWNVSTAEFYRSPLEDGFVGKHISIRKSLDYTYHNNYTPERQLFQDRLIKNNVLLNGSGSDLPWLVFTCGPMGAGKGWVLGWMSANGILPLERISKVDPDAFKLRMPEWSLYQRHSPESAGTKTHAESSYIAEIAQHLAMKNGMDVWVDGSLRHWGWYQIELQRIRNRFPQYRIAIVAIDAPEEIIETNIQKRAKETGRHISAELRRASAEGVERGLRKLTHLVDLIAHVRNCDNDDENSDSLQSPQLKSVSFVDRSGNWNRIKRLTSLNTTTNK